MHKKAISLAVVLAAFALLANPLAAQSAGPAKPAKADSAKVKAAGDELVLGEINIEAIIEKPNVDLIPGRVRPELNETTFISRSFSNEIKALPKDLKLYDEALDPARKMDDLLRQIRAKKKK